MRPPGCYQAIALICVLGARPLQAQRPTLTQAATVVAAPSSLNAWSPSAGRVLLTWPAVAGAEKYRITQFDNPGAPEVTVAEASYSWFVLEGATCAAGTSQPTCIFDDTSTLRLMKSLKKRRPGLDPTRGAGAIYPHHVTSGKLYAYRVWSIFPRAAVSGSSPPATVQVK